MHARHHPPGPSFLMPLVAGGALMAMSGRGHQQQRRGGRRGGFGGGSWGMGMPFGPGFGRGGPKARRGDIRTAMLLLLAEEPRNGYQLIQEIERRSDGAWRPSAGSVYPGLQQLEDEGLVRSEESDGRKLFHITDEGRAHVEEALGGEQPPWEAMAQEMGDEVSNTMGMVRQVALAAAQVVRTGSERQIKEAGRILSEARQALYRLLAEDEPRHDETE